jgi:prepilin-type N-terminal cleavage/methylation domain-containing protein
MRPERGHSLLEILVAVAIISLLFAIVIVYFQHAQKSQTLAMNNEVRTGVVKQVNDLLTAAMSAPGTAIFDPKTTLTKETGTLAPAGFWRLDLPNQTPPYEDHTTAQAFDFGGGVQITQDSHTVVSYLLQIDSATNALTKTLKFALISRCVDATAAAPTDLATIQAMPRPMWINNQVYCCANLAACPDPQSQDPKMWPTIFVLRPGNPIQLMPSPVERFITPGVGFMIVFDKHISPTSAHFTAFLLENKCKTTDVGYKGRAPLNCSRTEIGKIPDANFATDVGPMSVMESSRPLTTDMTGSGFMKL